jgi:hypothetical protein
MITKNCNNPRCFINGQHNEGDCQCEINIDKLSDETLLGLVEDNDISCDSYDEAMTIVSRLNHLSLNDRVFKVLNTFAGKYKKAGV